MYPWYWLTICFFRAWNISCLAISQAQGLGLHLESDAPLLDACAKNLRGCVWHTLHSLESALVQITGRVPLIREAHCSAPVPGTVGRDILEIDDEGHPVPDPYFLSQRRLFAIINESVVELYNTKSACTSQADYQEHVARFDARLAKWKAQLPEDLKFELLPTRVTEATTEHEVDICIGISRNSTR